MTPPLPTAEQYDQLIAEGRALADSLGKALTKLHDQRGEIQGTCDLVALLNTMPSENLIAALVGALAHTTTSPEARPA